MGELFEKCFILKYGQDPARALIGRKPMFYQSLYNNQINARDLIGQLLAMVYCAAKPVSNKKKKQENYTNKLTMMTVESLARGS